MTPTPAAARPRREAGLTERGDRRDRGDIVLGWLVRVTVGLAVLGLAVFDGLSIGSSRLAVQDTGVSAARVAARAWDEGHDVQRAYAAATAAAREDDPHNEVPPASFRITADGGISLLVRREAPTVVVHRVPWTAGWSRVEATVSRAGGV